MSHVYQSMLMLIQHRYTTAYSSPSTLIDKAIMVIDVISIIMLGKDELKLHVDGMLEE